MAAIRIIEVPPGEAPAEVRKAWVGLVLPLSGKGLKPKKFPTLGVISGPKSYFGLLWRLITRRFTYLEGYEVNLLAAIAVLERAKSYCCLLVAGEHTASAPTMAALCFSGELL